MGWISEREDGCPVWLDLNSDAKSERHTFLYKQRAEQLYVHNCIIRQADDKQTAKGATMSENNSMFICHMIQSAHAPEQTMVGITRLVR